MKFRDLFDVTLGRFFAPTPSLAPTSPLPGEVWVLSDGVYYRDTVGVHNIRLLKSTEYNVASGVPQLGVDGLIPAALLPAQSSLVGSLVDWCGSPTALPAGYLLCDGSEYLCTAYPALFAVIGTRYGRPSSSLNFKVPDATGRASVGGWSVTPSPGVPCQLHRVIIVNPGAGYASGTVTITGGTSSVAATVAVTATAGLITRVEVISCGNYTSASGLSIASGGGVGAVFAFDWVPVAPTTAQSWRIRVTAQGSGYAQATTSVDCGTGYASAVPVVSGGKVVEIIVTDQGIAVPSAITITGAGTGATAVVDQQPQYLVAGDYVGSPQHQLVTAELASHYHYNTPGGGAATGLNTVAASAAASGPAGGDVPHNNMPPVFAVTKLIRYL